MIKLNTKVNTYSLSNDKLEITLLKSGDIYQIHKGDIQVNLLKGNLLDGMVSNIYIRRESNGSYESFPLLGINSNSKFEVIDNQVIYQGIVFDTKYQVVLSLIDNAWHYDVTFDKSNDTSDFELYYVQDVAVASKGMIQSSEAYTGQYVDHKVFETKTGYTTLSRQNQGVPNLVQLGSSEIINSYSTDGFQFYGLSYKETNKPIGLLNKELESKNYQYEFPLIALQTKAFKLNEQKTFSFYGLYIENYEHIRTEEFEAPKHEAVTKFVDLDNATKVTPNVTFGSPLVGNKLTNEEALKGYNNTRNIEYNNDDLLAFFADDYKHVILQDKELLVERPHGHIIIHGDLINASANVMASTGFMNGIFASHIVLGNTNFHKLSGDVRNMLNVQKIAGLRIYLEVNNEYKILTLPSLFEINANNLKWVYKFDNDTIEVEYLSLVNDLQEKLTFKSLNNIKYNILITQPILMGDRENSQDIDFTINNNSVLFTAKNNQMIMNKYPNLKYRYTSLEDVTILDDEFIFGNEAQDGMIIFKYDNTASINLILEGTLESEFAPLKEFDLDKLVAEANNVYHNIIPLSIKGDLDERIKSFHDLSFWYVHNALVHYSSPHGLEQFNGAAWGTRDVVQGPFELFITAQKYDIARNILVKTFARQFIETGDFPQWFMYDNYYEIQAHDSHGDIIVWPLKALAHYLQVTSDFSILDEKIPYMSLKDNNFTKETYTLEEHIFKALETIRNSEIKNYPLPAYGGGDWNDTLQPANQELTKKMVSTWTVSLLYEALSKLNKVVPTKHSKLNETINNHQNDLKENYFKYLVQDGIPTGFTIFDDNKTSVLLHPNDDTTGLKYRLLSFNRGFISELFDKEKIEQYLDIMDKNLKHPDGMRLMDTPVTYNGGKTTYFMRAETATNFGREVGIHYIHAHIRYIEAMTKIGHGKNALDALLVVNPINIRKNVKNAMYRQSNTYFSSSDAFFYDRYLAKENFEQIRNGEVLVKAGWRVYSSGPGIYLNQLISNTLGIKVLNNDLLIDPTISEELNNVNVDYKYFGKDLNITYHLGNERKILVNNLEIESTDYINKYKENGFIISKENLTDLNNIKIDVYFTK